MAQAFANSTFKSCDATYQICPKKFYQVLIFMARIREVYITTFFVLMTRNTREHYDQVMSMIKDLLSSWGMDTSWRGHYFMTDFESALRQSFHAAFPYLFLIGCYFHWSQIIMKRVKNPQLNTGHL